MPVDYGGLTYKEIRAQVHTAVLDVYPDRVDDDLVKLWVQQGHLEVDRRLRWTRGKETFDTAVDDLSYSRETYWREIVAMVYDGEKVLEEIDFEDYLRRYDKSQSTGTPDYWATWDEELFLYPTPSAVKTITVYMVLPPRVLENDTDSPALNVELHWLIVDYALAKAYFHLQDTNTANNYYAKFERDIGAWEDNVESHRNRNIAVAPVWPAHA